MPANPTEAEPATLNNHLGAYYSTLPQCKRHAYLILPGSAVCFACGSYRIAVCSAVLKLQTVQEILDSSLPERTAPVTTQATVAQQVDIICEKQAENLAEGESLTIGEEANACKV